MTLDRSTTKARFPSLTTSKNQSRLFLIWTLVIEGRSLRTMQAWASSVAGDFLLDGLIEDSKSMCPVELHIVYAAIEALLRLRRKMDSVETGYSVLSWPLHSKARATSDVLKSTYQPQSEFLLSMIEEWYGRSHLS